MITSKEIEHNYIEIGYNKCNMNIAKCFILAILAGITPRADAASSTVALDLTSSITALSLLYFFKNSFTFSMLIMFKILSNNVLNINCKEM